METLKFKTNLKCDGCVKTITPYMNGIEGIESWQVDLDSPDKTVIINTNNSKKKKMRKAVEKALEQAGYHGELMK